ncbi:hypothetical protein PCI56_24395 [Plesiomonas shigelloides subsp. oncorhynchi]|nr:hypothetical protein [Plesiomonas shigelloides]
MSNVRPSAGPRTADSAVSSKAKKQEAYRWKPVNPVEEAPEVVTPMSCARHWSTKNARNGAEAGARGL